MGTLDLTDEEMDQRVGEVRESLLRTLRQETQDDLVAMPILVINFLAILL